MVGLKHPRLMALVKDFPATVDTYGVFEVVLQDDMNRQKVLIRCAFSEQIPILARN